MNNKKLLALYGLKWNPFLPHIPVEALWMPPGLDHFFFQIENLVMDGGFALLCGEPGLGKSKNLHFLAQRLGCLADVVVGVMERPQSNLGDFYREMGSLFGVNLSPANRYGGFKALRLRWQDHIKSTLFRAVLLIDEAQEMFTNCLNELRLLASANFDSQCLLTVVLCGDMRLSERFRANTLVSLGSRIRVRMVMEPYERSVLIEFLNHSLDQAGCPHLMTETLKETLVNHAGGNPRVLNNMGAELLERAAHKELPRMDEKLFLEAFSRPPKSRNSRFKKPEAKNAESKV